MAKRPKRGHPIRELRRIIRVKLQREFAGMIGISPDYLKKIEGGTRNLTPEIAKRIQREAGVNPRRLLKGRLRSIFDEQYTRAHYDEWKRRFAPQDQLIAKREADNLAPWIEILFRAAAKKNRLWQASDVLIESLNECRELFKLGPGIDGILAYEAKLPYDEQYGERPTIGWAPEGRGSSLARLWRRRRYGAWLRRYRARRHNRRVATNRRKRRSSRAPGRA